MKIYIHIYIYIYTYIYIHILCIYTYIHICMYKNSFVLTCMCICIYVLILCMCAYVICNYTVYLHLSSSEVTGTPRWEDWPADTSLPPSGKAVQRLRVAFVFVGCHNACEHAIFEIVHVEQRNDDLGAKPELQIRKLENTRDQRYISPSPKPVKPQNP